MKRRTLTLLAAAVTMPFLFSACTVIVDEERTQPTENTVTPENDEADPEPEPKPEVEPAEPEPRKDTSRTCPG